MYSVGNEKLIEGIKRFHLSGIGDRGIIRFVSGSCPRSSPTLTTAWKVKSGPPRRCMKM